MSTVGVIASFGAVFVLVCLWAIFSKSGKKFMN
jgi:hypothetical protein